MDKMVIEPIIGNNVFIGEYAVLEKGTRNGVATIIGDNAEIGALSFIVKGTSVGKNSRIEPGTIVKSDVPANAIVSGNPAVIIGYTNAPPTKLMQKTQTRYFAEGIHATTVSGVNVHVLKEISDSRGFLSVGELNEGIPFPVKRYFVVYKVPNENVRGEHAHRSCHQFLTCVAGSVSVVVDDGIDAEEILLDRPNIGLHLPPGIWGVQYKQSADAVLLVLASEQYDSNDYIRTYDEFAKYKHSLRRKVR